jgi:hypothetical protein
MVLPVPSADRLIRQRYLIPTSLSRHTRDQQNQHQKHNPADPARHYRFPCLFHRLSPIGFVPVV